jgi:L-gulono-1,4-lactone dehydrogenase
VRRWSNWARNVHASPEVWHAPGSEAEVVDLVQRSRGKRLRVVGAGHSWSPIAAPDQVGITLDAVTGIVDVNAEQTLATVRAGMRLHAFNAALASRGLALPILGSIAQQSLAGAIATGTHGSSLVHGNLASLVERMRIVDGLGNVHELTGDRLDAARVHLGALGVVTELTFRIVPAFRLAETVQQLPIRDIPAALTSIASSAEYVKVWWVPHTEHALVYRYERTAEPASRRPDPVRQRWFDERVMHAYVFPAVLRLGRIPGFTRRFGAVVAKGLAKPRRVGPSTLMLSTPFPARHRETEAALPMSAAGEAVTRIVDAIDRERLTVNFILEIRFVRGDRGWMSPAYGGDVCQIGAYCYGPQSDPYFAAFWRELRAMNGRPHWGKEMDHSLDEIRALWPETDRFRALRDELDPERVFGSAFHSSILG